MIKNFIVLLLALVTVSACARQSDATAEPPAPTDVPIATPEPTPEPTPEWAREGWVLVWQDEFDGETLNRENWTFDIGASGWGNNEWQFYTDRPENIRVENGMLVIEARKEDYLASDYTSARIKTQVLQTWTYGRFEARIKLPSGKGIWPAFWMLGEDVSTSGWPESGEIDVMENIGDPHIVYGTLHGPGYSGGNGIGSPFGFPEEKLNETFHNYAVEWYPDRVEWYFDEVLFNRVTIQRVPGDWVYNHPFFLIINVAVGGNWPGYPDETTTFPQQLVVDYIRVYQDPTLEIPTGPEDSVHVADIRMDVEKVDDVWQGSVSVLAVDSDGRPVEGVTVEGAWLGTIRGADTTAETGADGLAGPYIGKMNPFSGELSFCIVRLVHPLYNYAKSENTLTCLNVEPEAQSP